MSALTSSPRGLQPHDRRWPHRGAQLAAALRAALGPLALRVEHIGRTSIPGMAAPPVFDLQVSVRDLAAAALDGPLAGLGLRRLPHEADRIVPTGRRDDRRRWAKRCWAGAMAIRDAAAPGDAVREERVALYARTAGAPNERLAMLFRDWFRAHPEVVRACDAIPVALASFDAKDPVADLIAVTAEAWADRTGWRP